MKPPLFVRDLRPEERSILEKGLRSPGAFVVRRCQALLASSERLTPRQIAPRLKVSDQFVRNVIHAFHREGLDCLKEKSRRAKTIHRAVDEEAIAQIREMLHQSPRLFGLETSVWTLDGIAKVCFERGLTPRLVTGETIRMVLKRLGIQWQRAKRWITSPDPAYRRKRGRVSV